MKIVAIEAFTTLLPMTRAFTISGGIVGAPQSGAPHVYVKVTTDAGLTGWGEARPSPRWSYETLESVSTTIRKYFAPALVGRAVADLPELLRRMDGEIANGLTIGQPIAKASVDIALHDLIARASGHALSGLWQIEPRDSISLSYLISASSPEEAARLAQQAQIQGYKGVDVKIGFGLERDFAVLEAVHEYAKDLFFRVDANGRYGLSEARRLARGLGRLGVHVLEQPLPAHDLLGHRELRRISDVAIALDESVWSPENLLQAIRLEACDVLVVKLTKMGGLRSARLCGEIARAAGLRLLGGGLTESSLGLVASAHLFHSLEIDSPVDLNGPLFLAEDPVRPVLRIQNGEVFLPSGPGLGCSVDESALEKWRSDGAGV